MATIIGLQSLVLKAGVAAEDFERLFAAEVLTTAADAPGSVDRGGRSAIATQHLIRPTGGASDYLWVVKASGALSLEFETVMERMYDVTRSPLEPLCERRVSVVYSQVASFDVGPRDQMGRPTGAPLSDVEL